MSLVIDIYKRVTQGISAPSLRRWDAFASSPLNR